MKTIKTIGLSIGLAILGLAGAQAQEPRTNINPALLYFQGMCTAIPDRETQDYLIQTNWAARELPPEFGSKIGLYSSQLRFFRKAAEQKVPCDWGVDKSAGPETLLPHLGMMKRLAQIANLEIAWKLQKPSDDDESLAVKDMIAMFALGRNAASDKFLISVLVQYAIEAIDCSSIACHYYQLSNASMEQLLAGMKNLSAQVSCADGIVSEKGICGDWLVNKIINWQKLHAGDDTAVLNEFRTMFDGLGSDTNVNATMLITAGGGTSDGLIRLQKETLPFYDRLIEIYRLPYEQYTGQIKTFEKDFQASKNPLVLVSFPALIRAREKEFIIETKLAMVQAAIEYRLHGKEGFETIKDPCGSGPFKFEPFKFNGVDRGFKLSSALKNDKNPAVLIFVEKAGPPFRVDGVHAGEAQQP